MNNPLSFEQIIQQLKLFWQANGCLLVEPTDIEVGAGTFHPATFLECLGPNPSSVAYVQRCRRPADGRYGKNPNRYQLFHQFQVILKPSPVNIQELYLKSLEFIGFNLKEHDIRFVHDDWESPTLGANGLGWEVWMDGMEVTQFTYFQNVGGVPLDPITGEITYGLERLALFLQKKDSFPEILWNPTTTYESMFHRSEVEWSHYHLDEAPIETWQQHFNDYEKQSNELLNKNLLLPAYEFVTKASHAFNVLDARNAISVSSRTSYINRIRTLACRIAEKYVSEFTITNRSSSQYAVHPNSLDHAKLNNKEDFLFEIGTEEIPAAFINRALTSFKNTVEEHLKNQNSLYKELTIYKDIQFFATPRRMAFVIKDLQTVFPEQVKIKKGPKISQVFDNDGLLTTQGKSFFQSQNISPCTLSEVKDHPCLEIQCIKNNEHLVVITKKPAESCESFLKDLCSDVILKMSFPKKMRWSNYSLEFARPIRWLCSLIGTQVFPFQLQHLETSSITYGHRQLTVSNSAAPFLGIQLSVNHPSNYESILEDNKVIVDPNKRKEKILTSLSSLESEKGILCLDKHSSLLDEVNYLIEYPQLVYCTFDDTYLTAPHQILTSEMKKHQRYFPLFDANKQLINACAVISDNNPSDIIERGNVKVLSARLADGVFLFTKDCNTPVSERLKLLEQVEYLPKFGSMKDKSLRLANISKILIAMLPEDQNIDTSITEKIALLSKSDLTSATVCEFPDLQGIIGKEIALFQNESQAVASGIYEHWLPNSEKGDLPASKEAAVVSIADKLDTLICCYASNLKPTSSSDPFALRRQSIGIIRVLNSFQWHINISSLIQSCINIYPEIHSNIKTLTTDIVTYISERLSGLLKKENVSRSILRAVIDSDRETPSLAYFKSIAINGFLKDFEDKEAQMTEVYKRSKGQIKAYIDANKLDLTLLKSDYEQAFENIKPNLFEHDAELRLYNALNQTRSSYKESIATHKFEEGFNYLSKLQPSIEEFFGNVRVLADDESIKLNRISLLVVIVSMFDKMMNFESIYS